MARKVSPGYVVIESQTRLEIQSNTLLRLHITVGTRIRSSESGVGP